MLDRLLADDVVDFLELAQAEGWLCGRWEFDFLLRSFPHGCLTYMEDGYTLGYITSIAYRNSGWIGNLLVRPEARKRGIGRRLMEGAIAALNDSGVETIWLTASAQGAGLYRQLGFKEIDRINRWIGAGAAAEPAPPVAKAAATHLMDHDLAGWGDRRDALLRLSAGRGWSFGDSRGAICCQRWEGGLQIGPWGGSDAAAAAACFDHALRSAGANVFLDVPAKNAAASAILTERGFRIKGDTLLMYHGADPFYQPGRIYALASMGSMG